MRGERGLRPLSLFDAGDVRAKLVAEVHDLRVSDVAPRGQNADFSRTDAMAVLAAREAVGQARLSPGVRLGVALGGTTGGMFETEALLSSPQLRALPAEQAAKLVSFPLSAAGRAFRDRLHAAEQSAVRSTGRAPATPPGSTLSTRSIHRSRRWRAVAGPRPPTRSRTPSGRTRATRRERSSARAAYATRRLGATRQADQGRIWLPGPSPASSGRVR